MSVCWLNKEVSDKIISLSDDLNIQKVYLLFRMFRSKLDTWVAFVIYTYIVDSVYIVCIYIVYIVYILYIYNVYSVYKCI